MEQETGSQKKTLNGYVLEELLTKLNNGQDLTEEEMNDIMCSVLFDATDNSLIADQEGKKAKGLKVTLLTMAGKMCGRQTKFLPYVLQYRKEAAEQRKDNYNQVFEGFRITSMDVDRENLQTLVRQYDLVRAYDASYQELFREIEENIDDGLASFACLVGMESMIKMDEQKEKILSLSRQYKK